MLLNKRVSVTIPKPVFKTVCSSLHIIKVLAIGQHKNLETIKYTTA